MVSVTSTEESGVTMTSAWKSSMTSCLPVSAKVRPTNRAQAAKAPRTRRRSLPNFRSECQPRDIGRGSGRGSCGGTEADFRGLALGGCAYLKKLAWLEAQHAREDVRGELLDLGVQVADHRVVITPGILHGIFDLAQRVLQRCKTLNGAQLRICFRQREQ